MRRLSSAAIALTLLIIMVTGALLLPGGSPATAAGSAVTFAVIGDYGMDDGNEAAVASLVASWGPAYIIATGDDYYSPAGGTGTGKYDESTGAYYGDWLKDITTTGTRCPVGRAAINSFFPSMGNHDYSDATPAPGTYLAYFNLPGVGFTNTSGNERYYDFVEGPVHFFVLNSCSQEPDGTSAGSTQALWLKAGLAASTSIWNVVYDHHPPYSSDNYHGSTAYMQWPFAAWGADVVISGHAHTYERLVRDGIVYFVNGAGGAARYSFGTPLAGSVVRYNANWGAQKVTVTDTSMVFDFYNIDNGLIDTYTLTAAPVTPPPAAPTGLTATSVSSSRIDIGWSDPADNETGFKIERSPDGSNWSQIATVGSNVTAFQNTGLAASTTYNYRVRAYNSSGDSGYSNTATATTKATASSMHVGDLDGSSARAKRAWTATVIIVIHDANEQPLAGVTVSGSWGGGTTGSVSAVTDASGRCRISKKNLKLSLASVTLTVTGLAKTGYAYAAGSNHDVDAGTNGTTITVRR